MTEQSPSAIGTVAQEAARLIEDMATLARASTSRVDDPTPYAGKPAPEPYWPEAGQAKQAGPAEDQTWGPAGDEMSQDFEAQDYEAEDYDEEGYAAEGERAEGDRPGADDGFPAEACSLCGADADDTPSTCRLCPLCKGIALLRSVRPETVDLLADLALSVAASLRDVAKRSRASDRGSSAHGSSAHGPSGHGSSARSTPGSPSRADRSSVQDISVDDESEG
jgi:hypothetical protein